jgi:energy-coupling factor transport system ATP-binding protein
VRNLSFAYRRRGDPSRTVALRDVSFDLPSAGCVALIGPNGSGKTTVSKLINGILRPDGGEILLDRKRVEPHRRPGTCVAYAFQNPDDQLFAQSVRHELEFGPRNMGLPPRIVQNNVNEAAESLGLLDALDSHPLDLPFVLRKRVSIAAALAMDRPWTVLDEPTLSQDHAFQRRLIDAFRRLQAKERGLIVISHDPEFVFEACGHTLLLVEGNVGFAGTCGDWAARNHDGVFDFSNLTMHAATQLSALAGASHLSDLRLCIARIIGTRGISHEQRQGPNLQGGHRGLV